MLMEPAVNVAAPPDVVILTLSRVPDNVLEPPQVCTPVKLPGAKLVLPLAAHNPVAESTRQIDKVPLYFWSALPTAAPIPKPFV